MDWLKIKNEYINGNISYRELCEKYGCTMSSIEKRASKEKWVELKKRQHAKIEEKMQKKTVEKIAEKESNRLARISAAADKLLEKIEKATEELDLYLLNTKRSYTTKGKDPNTQEVVEVLIQEDKMKTEKVERIDRAGLKQLASALKDLKDIQIVVNEPQSQTIIPIVISGEDKLE